MSRIRITKDKITGRFVHRPTGLVVCKENRRVTCVQMKDGKTRLLTRLDVERAKSYSLKISPDVEIDMTVPILIKKIRELPNELQGVIYSYDDTYKTAFKQVVNEMNNMLSMFGKQHPLVFKKKYRGIFNIHPYIIYCRDWKEDFNLVTIERFTVGTCNVNLRAYKILLYMKLLKHNFYSEYDLEECRNYNMHMESAGYGYDRQFDSDSDSD